MFGKADLFPMLVNVGLIVGGVMLVCVAGTDALLEQHVKSSVTGVASVWTFMVNSIILFFTAKVVLILWHKQRCLCAGVVALGVGILTATRVFLLPLLDQTLGALGKYFIEYVNIISITTN